MQCMGIVPTSSGAMEELSALSTSMSVRTDRLAWFQLQTTVGFEYGILQLESLWQYWKDTRASLEV